MSDRRKKTGAARQSDRGGRRLTSEQRPAARDTEPGGERRASREEPRAKTAAAVMTKEAPEKSAPRRKEASGTVRDTAARFCQTVRKKALRVRRRWHHIVREKRARNFPESERAPIQLLLFAWSMLPMVGSRLREATWGRRKQAIHHVSDFRAWSEHHRIHPAAFLGGHCDVLFVLHRGHHRYV